MYRQVPAAPSRDSGIERIPMDVQVGFIERGAVTAVDCAWVDISFHDYVLTVMPHDAPDGGCMAFRVNDHIVALLYPGGRWETVVSHS